MELYQKLFDSAPDAMLAVDAHGRIVRLNAEAARIFGYEVGELAGHPIEKLVPQRFIARHAEDHARYFATPRRRPMGGGLELRGLRKNGTEFPVDVMLNSLETQSGVHAVAIVRDLSGRQSEIERQRFVALADSSKEFIGMCDQNFRPFYVNPAGLQMVGLDSVEAACQVKVQDFFFPEDQSRITDDFFPRVTKSGNEDVEIRFRHFKTGAAIWMLYNVFNLRDASGTLIGWATVSRNIHDRKCVEEALRASEERLRLAQQVGHVGTFELNVQTGVNTWSPEAEAMHGLNPGSFPGRQGAWFDLVHPDDRAVAKQLVERAFETRMPTEGEWRVVWPDGSIHWIAGRFQLFVDQQGQPLTLTGINLDITARKDAEEQLRRVRDDLEIRVRERTEDLTQSLREKEVLLREIHHRVKNNLAVIGSLFYLQSINTDDSATLSVLNECQDRVRSMALIHERLYRTGDLARVDFGEYAAELSKELFRNYSTAPGKVHLKLKVSPIMLDVDRAIPCGLILNEFISNALKHAFPHQRQGEIAVTLERTASGEIVLAVIDSGVGLPDETQLSTRRSLGMRLIQSLSKQLDGRVDYVRHAPGTEARLTLEHTDAGHFEIA